jgi:hypothetical protein
MYFTIIRPINFILLLFLSCGSALFAQKSGNSLLSGKEIGPGYFEKVYLHLDRHFYATGENVWFKAYLVNARSNKLSGNSSKNLYVELISPASQLLYREVLRIDYGVSSGDFKLSDTLPGGKYRIRAYTKWMMNFGDAFVFEKEISIVNPIAKKKIRTLSESPSKNELRFFPEGGSLVEGVENVVAFKACNSSGKGQDITGTIVSSPDNNTITWFQSINLGMGKFSFKPESGKNYYAICTINNDTIRMPLPVALKKGFTLRVNSSDSLMTLFVAANEPAYREFKGRMMMLTIQQSGTSRRLISIPINKALVISKIPLSFLPAGLLRVILSDSVGRPHCERLVFNEQPQSLKVTLVTDQPAYAPHQQTSIKLRITDLQNQPVRANLSLSVTDAGVIPGPLFNIRSYLTLESEIRGRIEQPMIYFDPSNSSRLLQLDLLLLTQGWSDYLWRHLEDSVNTKKHEMERGLSVTGTVTRKYFEKTTLPDMNITMYLPGVRTMPLRSTTSDKTGKFDLDVVDFYGTKSIMLSCTDKKGKQKGYLHLDSLYVRAKHNPFKITKQTENDSLPGDQTYAKESVVRDRVLRKYKLSDTIMLKEIVVKSIPNQGVQKASFVINPGDTIYYDLGWYLQTHWPPFNNERISRQIRPIGKDVLGLFRNRNPGIDGNLNSIQSELQKDMLNVSIDKIEKIEIYRENTLLDITNIENLGTMPKDNYIIQVYVKPNAFEKIQYNSINTIVSGYYRPRTFYAPIITEAGVEGKTDYRTTIHWVPNIVTDENGELSVSYNNSLVKNKISIVFEGITEKNGPVTKLAEYQVK